MNGKLNQLVAAVPTVAVMMLLPGCTPAETPSVALAVRAAWNEVEVSFARSNEDADKIEFNAQAHFSRFAGLPGIQAKMILGAAEWEPIPLETCQTWDKSAELDAALRTVSKNPAAWIELVDAGRLDLQFGTNSSSLIPIDYPELLGGLSGTAYTNDSRSLTWQSGQPLVLRSAGTRGLAPFQITVEPPAEFPGLRANLAGENFLFAWNKLDTPATEPFLLELKSTVAANRVIRCRVVDDGSFTLSVSGFSSFATSFSQAHDVAWTATGTRSSRAHFSIPNIGLADVKVALRDTVRLPSF